LFANPDFVKSISRSTGDRASVKNRFKLVHEILGDV
jgi:hypothetical protein